MFEAHIYTWKWLVLIWDDVILFCYFHLAFWIYEFSEDFFVKIKIITKTSILAFAGKSPNAHSCWCKWRECHTWILPFKSCLSQLITESIWRFWGLLKTTIKGARFWSETYICRCYEILCFIFFTFIWKCISSLKNVCDVPHDVCSPAVVIVNLRGEKLGNWWLISESDICEELLKTKISSAQLLFEFCFLIAEKVWS